MPRTRLAAAVLGLAALTACGGSDDSTAGSGTPRADADDLVHVHDVLVGPGGSPVYLAAHTGLYELRDNELAARSDRFDDLMAAAIEPDGTLIASGHPDLSNDELRVENKPPLLGLVESDDGTTWTPGSLLGDADFHALVVTGEALYGADSLSARVLVSDDGGHTWQSRAGEAQLLDLAIDPADADQMMGVDLDRGLVASNDGASTWEPVDAAPELLDLEWTSTALVGLGADGSVHRSTDAGRSWQQLVSLDGAQALGSDGTDLYAFVAQNSVHRSDDGGESWNPITP